MWNGTPLDSLPGAIQGLPEGISIVPFFAQDHLGLDVVKIEERLRQIPVYDAAEPLAWDKVAWVPGNHPALAYRGSEIKRKKLWLADTDLHKDYFVKYRYTGWQWRIAAATLPMRAIPEVSLVYKRLLAGGMDFNHAICTRYEDSRDYIGRHSDKTADLGGEGILVIKLGPAARPFEIIKPISKKKFEPIFKNCVLPGTAIWMSLDANKEYQHAVPAWDPSVRKPKRGIPPNSKKPKYELEGVSGSIVFRKCVTYKDYPWKDVVKRMALAAKEAKVPWEVPLADWFSEEAKREANQGKALVHMVEKYLDTPLPAHLSDSIASQLENWDTK